MKNNGSQTCRQGEEIVSYIYDELTSVERRSFESHIVGCNTCTGELGALSDARLSVYEWHREEFDPLPTPRIEIPYKAVIGDETESFVQKLAASLKGIFDIARSPLAFTSILFVCLGVGFVAFNYIGAGTDEIAANSVVPPQMNAEAIAPIPEIDDPVVASTSEKENVEVVSDRPEVVKASDSDRVDPVTKARAQKHQAVATRKPAGRNSNITPVRRVEQAPLLSDYREIEDDTLRLSDLLDMVGG